MKSTLQLISLFILFALCPSCMSSGKHQLLSIQLIDRHGLRESIHSRDRLNLYERVDFHAPQPYQKIVRIYQRDQTGKTRSHITSYHDNGQIWQYLEVLSGRASGIYREWYPNGQLRLDVKVIEGMGDINEQAMLTWVFDETSRVFYEKGGIKGEFAYDKGVLEGIARYYHANGQLSQTTFYQKGVIHGDVILFDEQGDVVGQTHYIKGLRQGVSTFKGDGKNPPYSEEYRDDKLIEGTYYDLEGNIIVQIKEGKGKKALFNEGTLSEMQEYQQGVIEGVIQYFDQHGNISSEFQIQEGIKEGEERIYYSKSKTGNLQCKIAIPWHDHQIHGIVRSWYPNGALESEREMSRNHKQGLATAWYLDGSLMLVEEYDQDRLIKGTYMKRGESKPLSSIEKGEGVATLFDKEGQFIRRIVYEKGEPVDEL